MVTRMFGFMCADYWKYAQVSASNVDVVSACVRVYMCKSRS
jgi:hypothetical protein